MRWGPEADQTLLSTILEAHAISLDCDKIAAIWPSKEGEDNPTPRAIRERIFKIKKNAGSNATPSTSDDTKKTATKSKKATKTKAATSTASKKRKVSSTDNVPQTPKRAKSVVDSEAPIFEHPPPSLIDAHAFLDQTGTYHPADAFNWAPPPVYRGRVSNVRAEKGEEEYHGDEGFEF